MPYKYMSKEEIEISKIKNITSIKVYNLLDQDKEAVMGILCSCTVNDKQKFFNYTELDKHFVNYFSTLKRIYNLEKDKRKIYIDEESKRIIEYSEEEKEAVLGKKVDNKLIDYKTENIECYFNIITSTLKDIFKLFNRNIEFLDIKAIGNNAVITYKEDFKKYLRVYYEKEDDTIKLRIASILKNKELVIEIKDNKDLEISFYDDDHKIEGKKKIKRNILKEEVYINSKIVYSKITELDLLDAKEDEITYRLPFSNGNDLRIIKKEKGKEIFKETITDININNYHTRKRVYKSAVFVSDNYKGVISSKIHIKLEETKIEINTYKVGDYTIEETSYFEAPLSNAYYKEYLEGKTFYRIFKDDEELEVPFNIKGYELMDENELKLKLRSDK